MKDLIILGNGMAGMTAALYAARAKLDFKIVGKDEFNFGQIGDAILVENYPCTQNLSGFDLAMSLHEQLAKNNIQIEEHTVNFITRNENSYLVEYEDGIIEEAKTIIYALGAQHRRLKCHIEDNIPIHYCALCDGSFYKDKHIVVIGGGDSAFTQAEYLSKICRSVYILMCDNNVTASPTTFERVKAINNIKIVYNYPVDFIGNYRTFGEDKKYWIRSKQYDLGFVFDGIFVAIGMIPNTTAISKDYNIKHILNEQNYIMADENGRTACQGFFTAGDVRQKQLRQSITAAADGANCVQSVINYLKEGD